VITTLSQGVALGYAVLALQAGRNLIKESFPTVSSFLRFVSQHPTAYTIRGNNDATIITSNIPSTILRARSDNR
jgi:hypothetical protein